MQRPIVGGKPADRSRTGVQSGANADPPALRAAVLTLRLAGQTESARKIALQALIAGAG